MCDNVNFSGDFLWAKTHLCMRDAVVLCPSFDFLEFSFEAAALSTGLLYIGFSSLSPIISILGKNVSVIVSVRFYFALSGYRNHDKKKSHKYDSSKSRMRKKGGGREKDSGAGLRRGGGGGRASGQRLSRSHSDDEEDEGVPASYHTVSLQVSQDVSTGAFFTLLPPLCLCSSAKHTPA